MNPWGLPSRDERPLRKLNSVKDRDVLQEYAETHHHCALCGSESRARQIHHIIGGRGGRSDERVNLLMVCFFPCHPFVDLASNLGVVLYVKMLEGELDGVGMERLEVLHGKTLPEFEPIPEPFWSDYRKNRGRM